MQRILHKRKHYPVSELRRYIMTLATAVVVGIVHLYFAIFFAVVSCKSMAVAHVLGVAVAAIVCVCNMKRRYDIGRILMSGMIILCSILSVYWVGGVSNYAVFYLSTVLMMGLILPYEDTRFDNWQVPIILLLMIAVHLYAQEHVPMIDLGEANQVMTISNIITNVGGIACLVAFDRKIQAFLDDYQQQHLHDLANQAYLDPLTGLHNRRYIDEYFEAKSVEPPKHEVFVAMGDLDNFKDTNDIHGHDAGDRLLKAVAEVMLRNTRKTDIVCRWGGEEFLLVIHNTTQEETFVILDKLREKISEIRVPVGEDEIKATMTLGMARLDLRNIPKSMDACDKNLYIGKTSGKNRVVAHPTCRAGNTHS